MTLFIPISSSTIRWECVAAAIDAASVAEDKSINSLTNNLFSASSLERLKYRAAKNYAKSSKNKGNSRSQCTLKNKWAQWDFTTIEHGEKNQYGKIMAVHLIFLFCTRRKRCEKAFLSFVVSRHISKCNRCICFACLFALLIEYCHKQKKKKQSGWKRGGFCWFSVCTMETDLQHRKHFHGVKEKIE